MTIEEQIEAILSAAAGVTSLRPAPRIKVPGDWQNLPKPYIVHFPVSMTPTRCHDGLKALQVWDFYQVSIFADLYSAGTALTRAVKAALDGKHQIGSPVSDGIDVQLLPSPWYMGMDPETKTHQFVLNFRIAEALA